MGQLFSQYQEIPVSRKDRVKYIRCSDACTTPNSRLDSDLQPARFARWARLVSQIRCAMTDSEEIKNTLSRFMNSFDLKDWGLMANQLDPRVRINYAHLRGDPPSEVGAAEYVRSRSEALQDLSTQHLMANFEVVLGGESASANASCMIWRWNGTTHFNSHAFYKFSLVRRGASWKIDAIEQRILWSEGDSSIHKGVGRGCA